MVQAAYASTQTKKGAKAFTKLAAMLTSVVNMVPENEQDVAGNRKRVISSLVKLGAKIQKAA